MTRILVVLALVLVVAPARADDLGDAKAFIAKQVEQITKSDTAALKAGFSKRLQDRITDDAVKSAQKQVGTMTIDDLVASATSGKDGIKIKMKNGRSLTTLIKEDGKLVADTVWFK